MFGDLVLDRACDTLRGVPKLLPQSPGLITPNTGSLQQWQDAQARPVLLPRSRP